MTDPSIGIISRTTRQATAGATAVPGRAPACGARRRAGGSCLGLAMASGRCRLHGGASTGPRTAAGLARMVAAKTTHGRFAVSGAPKRQAERRMRTIVVRMRLTAAATQVREYLPGGMAARLDSVPEELLAPKHPSQVAFEALHAAAVCPCAPVRLGLGRRARARLGAGGEVADGAAVVLRGRAAERLAMRAETASQAPWRAAIVAAGELKQAICEARRQMRGGRNDPIGGAGGSQTPEVRNDPIGGTGESQTRGGRNDPISGAGGSQTPGVRNDPIGGTGESQTQGVRNDPIGGMAALVQAAGAALDTRRAGEITVWAPGSPGLAEALARELEKRRLRAVVGLRGNDPIGGTVTGGGSGGAERVVPAVTGSGSMRGLALGGTTLARIWEPSVAEVLAARFGPAVVEGWLGGPVAPPGIAAMPSGGGAQRPYRWLGRASR